MGAASEESMPDRYGKPPNPRIWYRIGWIAFGACCLWLLAALSAQGLVARDAITPGSTSNLPNLLGSTWYGETLAWLVTWYPVVLIATFALGVAATLMSAFGFDGRRRWVFDAVCEAGKGANPQGGEGHREANVKGLLRVQWPTGMGPAKNARVIPEADGALPAPYHGLNAGLLHFIGQQYFDLLDAETGRARRKMGVLAGALGGLFAASMLYYRSLLALLLMT